MASVYLDHNVPADAAGFLRADQHVVRSAVEVQLERATGDVQLLEAARRGWVIVTNNVRDFILLHDAWHLWSREWGVTPQHAGILLTRQTWNARRLADEVSGFLATGPALTNQLYQWHGERGWVRRAPPATQ